MDKRSVTAWLLGVEPNELASFRDYGDHVAVLNTDGQKFTFTNEQLAQGGAAMKLMLTIGGASLPTIQDQAALVKKPPVRKKSPAKASNPGSNPVAKHAK